MYYRDTLYNKLLLKIVIVRNVFYNGEKKLKRLKNGLLTAAAEITKRAEDSISVGFFLFSCKSRYCTDKKKKKEEKLQHTFSKRTAIIHTICSRKVRALLMRTMSVFNVSSAIIFIRPTRSGFAVPNDGHSKNSTVQHI